MKKEIIIILSAASLVGCSWKQPYDKPEFVEIQANQTAFVFPLEGDTSKQDAFASSDLLLKRKVAEKRIQVPHRWIKTGKKSADGQYIATIRVVAVDRKPVTVEWDVDEKKYLSAESRDSIGLSSGFTLTAFIPENSAHTYLYYYKTTPLAEVIQNQVFNSIQTVYSEQCAKYDLGELRGKKAELTKAIRERIIPFYKEYGIEIVPDMGLSGGLKYENVQIQQAIDKVFMAQQLKAENEARLAAQKAENEKTLSIAKNDAEQFVARAEGEATAIAKKAEAIAKAGQLYIQVEQVKVMGELATKWNGQTPQIMGQMPLMLDSRQLLNPQAGGK